MGRNPPKTPERPRARKLDDSRRARLYLAELAWLTGAPEDGRWRRFDTDELFALDGVRISKARRAARTVLREHPSSLKALVGDVERWWSAVDAKLAWCSTLVANPRAPFDPLPLLPNRIGKLVRGYLARDFAIAWLEEPDVVERAIGWLTANASALAALDARPHVAAVGARRLASALARLAVVGDRKAVVTRDAGVAALIAALATDAPDPQGAIDRVSEAEVRLLREDKPPPNPPARVGPKLVEWVLKLCTRGSADRQRSLALIAVAGLAEVYAEWESWERKLAPVLGRAAELAGNVFDHGKRAKHVDALDQQLVAARRHPPPIVAVRDVILEVDMLASETMLPFHASIARLLTACGAPRLGLPAHGRVNLLLHVARAAACTEDVHPEWLWDALAQALERGAPVEILGPWLPMIGKKGRYWLEYDLVENAKRRADVDRLVDVLATFATHHAPTEDEADKAATWLAAGVGDAGVIVDVVARLADVHTRLDDDLARAVLALADGTAADIAAVARSLLELSEDERWHLTRTTVAFIERAAGGGAGWIVRGALASHRGLLVEAGAVAASLPASKWPPLGASMATPSSGSTATTAPRRAGDESAATRADSARGDRRPAASPRSSPVERAKGDAQSTSQRRAAAGDSTPQRPPLEQPAAWIGRYPEGLRLALSRLAAVDPEAERTAAKKLATDLPDPADLEREIAALRASGKAPKRLASLEHRLAHPSTPSPKRLANLAAKLEVAGCEIALSRFIAIGSAQVGERFLQTFALPSWDAWTTAIADVAGKPGSADTARLRELLFALLELPDSADRELAGRLLRARCGPPPWDLRDDPANQKFVARMRAAKLDPAPWLDDRPRSVTAKDGKPVALGFAADPLDVFAMGWHFDTCLSPRGGNFFSVLANAADINKRVLYARRDGRVLGRCLFALTDGLALIVFQQYCHDGGIDFPALVREFATDLAARIGTQLAPRGPVRTLLARDWYDDGARDLVGRFAGLDDKFDIRSIAPEQLVSRLRELLGRDLDDVSLPIVINHQTLRGQPRHLAPLVPFILASNVSQLRLEAARLAMDNDDLPLADRLLGDHDHAIRIADHAWYWGELLARVRPSKALARLRASRPRHVRSWADEPGDRIALAGLAFEMLHRPRQAAEMYRLAIKYENWLGDQLRARLHALGEPIEGGLAG